jgi:hypothetical protein
LRFDVLRQLAFGMTSVPAEMDDWCQRWLGAGLDTPLFTTGGVSRVFGVRLVDGREVVIKVRRPESRYYGCVAAHQRIWEAGFPCPEPLAGPVPFGDELATAERFVPGGDLLEPSTENAERYAWALAELVRVAPAASALPSLDPPPAWAWWDYPGPGTWAWQSAAERALAAERGWARPEPSSEQAWLEDLAVRTRARLATFRAPPVVAHVDWWMENLRWLQGKLFVVHDWDSLAAQPEAIICGFAATTFHESLAHWVQADLAQSEAFIAAYERARGCAWTREEREICWAAGLWHNSHAISAASGNTTFAARAALLKTELPERLRLAGWL